MPYAVLTKQENRPSGLIDAESENRQKGRTDRLYGGPPHDPYKPEAFDCRPRKRPSRLKGR